MKVNNLSAEIHMPKALKSVKGPDGVEKAQQLPPSARQATYAVDEYPACPTNWEHGSDKASSYFVAVEPNKGMWLDFNSNVGHTHDVAIVVSIQGVNSITGKKTNTMGLEQYRTNCPTHNVPFQQDRYCPECKYKWPAQNYLSTTGTPGGLLWLDGFRSADGVVRQYVFTEDEARGVAAQKIGKDRVHAIGIAFYLSKEPKPKPVYHGVTRGINNLYTEHLLIGASPAMHYGVDTANSVISSDGSAPFGSEGSSFDVSLASLSCDNDSGSVSCGGIAGAASDSISGTKYSEYSAEVKTSGPWKSFSPPSGPKLQAISDEPSVPSCSCDEGVDEVAELPTPLRTARIKRSDVAQIKQTKTYEIAAGARIDQEVYADPKELSYWEEEPAGMIYVNYCTPEDLAAILKAGKRQESPDGFLADVPVGHD